MKGLPELKTCIIVGTRPEIIKMSPIIKECQRRKVDFDVINPRQHFDENMCDIFFKELELPVPLFSFKVTPGGHAQQISSLMLSFDRIFSKKSYDIVLLQGDTNSAFAAAVIASRHNISIGHIEAGLRSRDKTMPEETNRIMIDHLSLYLFAASSESFENLITEGINEDSIWITGNTIVDATRQSIEIAKKKLLNKKHFNNYILLTLHRPGNVDSEENFKEILEGIQRVSSKYGLLIIFPIHPRTKSKLRSYGYQFSANFHLLDPLGYLDFLYLENNARLIMTDSGGVQEEACILQIPCVTLRRNTERPETISVGANNLGGVTKEEILIASEKMLNKHNHWKNPYGDGHSAEKILDIVMSNTI